VDIDDVAKLIDAVTKLVGVLAWPGLALFVLVRFGPSLRDFFSDLGELTLKGAGFEASVKRKRAEAVAALAAAAASRPDAATTPIAKAEEAKAAAKIVSEAVTSRVIRRASSARVLWVDDRPDNNIFERQSLEALGISITLALTTDEALDRIRTQTFDAIISDMGRPQDPQAGYTLLEKLRAMGNNAPYIIYASSRAPEHVAEARRRGAMGCTNRADELFQMVLAAFGKVS